jgi:hypothetical protein
VPISDEDRKKLFSELGSRGQKAFMENTSKAKRHKIAVKAAKARWNKKQSAVRRPTTTISQTMKEASA